MDVSQYLEIFIEETKEHLQSLNEQLLILEREPENKETINEIFRAAHSLKGMAGTMGYKRMQKLTHNMENVFQEIRNDKMKVSSELVDGLFRGLDALEEYLSNITESSDEGTNNNQDLLDLFEKELEKGINGGEASDDSSVKTAESGGAAVQAEVKTASDECVVKEMSLGEYEKNAIVKAAAEGMNAYAVTVYIQDTCLLKAARAFLVFKAVEEIG